MLSVCPKELSLGLFVYCSSLRSKLSNMSVVQVFALSCCKGALIGPGGLYFAHNVRSLLCLIAGQVAAKLLQCPVALSYFWGCPKRLVQESAIGCFSGL